MAFRRDRSSFWSRLRRRLNLDSPNIGNSRPVLPMDIWNLLDGFSGVPPARSTRLGSGGFVTYTEEVDRLVTDLLWLTNGNRERGQRPPEFVDTAAVLRKCRKIVYKPTSSVWGKAKAETDQSECPVCLERLVAKDKLFMLPCKHQFHVDCLTPWIKRNNTCCPCCRADIQRGPKRDERMNASINERSNIRNFPQWRSSQYRDLRNESAATGHGLNIRIENVANNRHTDVGVADAWISAHEYDAWEGLHEYIMAALAEVDAELNRFIR